jgi:hypothetical protein
MRQNEKILRYLTVRTDEDLKKAARRPPRGGEPQAGDRDHRDREPAAGAGDLHEERV